MIDITSKLLDTIGGSTCFGIAYDDTIPECIQCDVRSQCKAKSEGGDIPTPMIKAEKTAAEVSDKPKGGSKPKKTEETPKDTSESTLQPPKESNKPPKKPTKPPTNTNTNTNLPDFKSMSTDALKAMAKERAVEWKDYGNDNITRMRLIMALKKSF